jgi:hypothetical protein
MLQARSGKDRYKVQIRPHPLAAVYLSRETLLVMTSAQLEHRVQRLKEQRPLTSAELEEVARQRRLVKNREQARLSRIRKKRQLRDLEQENEALAQENMELREQLQKVNAQFAQLLAVAQGPPAPPLIGFPFRQPPDHAVPADEDEDECTCADYFMDESV